MWLTHYTDCQNYRKIQDTRVLRCALRLMNEDESVHHARTKRSKSLPLTAAVLRDQQPLTERIVLCDGATFDDFVEYLNGHVFFWPSNYTGEQCREKFQQRYARSGHIDIQLRCRLSDLRAANPDAKILFSSYNSGATPRDPEKSPRCRNLFQPLESRGGKRLVEVVVRGEVQLPDNTEVKCEKDEWREFFP